MTARSVSAPRRSSLGYRRSRASSRKPYIRKWPKYKGDQPKILGFPGYKAGMTRVIYNESNKNSHLANTSRITAVSVIETPPVIMFGIRSYKMTPYGRKILGDVITNSPSRFFKRRRRYPEVTNYEDQLTKFKENIDEATEIRALIHTQPDLTGIGTKTPEIFEIKIGGPDNQKIVEWAEDKIGKELQIEDFTTPGQFVDTIGITKGKGFQGVVKRHGITKLPRKTKDGPRKVGSIGPWTPARLRWNIPRYGQLGYFRRTEYNKRVMQIGTSGDDITPKGGFVKYGVVKNRYILVKGSIPGPKKRVVVLRDGMRSQTKTVDEPKLSFVSQRSQR